MSDTNITLTLTPEQHDLLKNGVLMTRDELRAYCAQHVREYLRTTSDRDIMQLAVKSRGGLRWQRHKNSRYHDYFVIGHPSCGHRIVMCEEIAYEGIQSSHPFRVKNKYDKWIVECPVCHPDYPKGWVLPANWGGEGISAYFRLCVHCTGGLDKIDDYTYSDDKRHTFIRI